MKYRFGGINIYAERPEAVLQFYKALGFRVLQEPSEPWFGAMLALQMSAGQVPVIWIWQRTEGDTTVCCNHLAFMTDGHLEAVYRQILSSGMECDPPFIAPWGGKELILHDPAGNELLFL